MLEYQTLTAPSAIPSRVTICLDYIFYNNEIELLKVDKIYETKPELLPNSENPSDHIPILATF